ncbi:MAG: YraN family protein [Deltaproteobacteria bacterium]|nr:YraN family protein [Candidatus Zymogenaceae bacterium]
MKPDKEGRFGERIARWMLILSGYRIIESNYRTRYGEIDIVARDGDDLVFVEVKTKSSREYGPPEESVDEHKQRKIARMALMYLTERQAGEDTACRFDVVTVDLSGILPKIRVIPNAFEAQ